MKKLALCTGALLFLSGCHSSKPSRQISAIPRDTAGAFSVSEHAGAAAEARKHGIDIYWNGPSGDHDAEQQIALAEEAIDRRDLGIVLSPSSPFALSTVIRRALSRGIPVVIVGAPIPLTPGGNLSFVLNDVRQMGLLAAQRVRQVVGDRGEVLISGINPMLPGSVERAEATEKGLREKAPDIKIAKKLTGMSSFGQLESATETAIRTHPHLAAIVALNPIATQASVAAVRAARAAARVRIIGCDQELDLFFQLRHGAVDSLIVENMRAMGAAAVENILDLRRGTPVAPVAYFQPALVTRSNIDEEAMQKMLMMDWRPRS